MRIENEIKNKKVGRLSSLYKKIGFTLHGWFCMLYKNVCFHIFICLINNFLFGFLKNRLMFQGSKGYDLSYFYFLGFLK